MPVDRHKQGTQDTSGPTDAGCSRPRVVIFERDGLPRVEVIEIEGDAEIGTLFCHLGTSWRVTDLRTHDRVLICRPAEA